MGGLEAAPDTLLNARQRRPMPALVNGPTNAIQNSIFALVGSFSICETPPSANNVISRTGSPLDFATTEWANSCNRREMKNNIAVATASARMTPSPHSGLLV